MEALNGTYDAKAKTITFEAEDYADYALVYQETDKPDDGGGNDQEPETDDNTKKVTAGNLEVPKDDYEVSGNQAAEAGVYTMTITAKEGTNFTGSREWTYVVAPVKMSQITKDKDGKVQIGHGTFSVKIEQDKDTAQAALVTSEAEFIEKLVDAGDITADELLSLIHISEPTRPY